MDGERYLEDILLNLRKLKMLAEVAIAQISDEQLFETLDDKESNSIAIIMKHVAGNMRSRWTDFLVSDGEKPDRHRDTEFVIDEGENKDRILDRWENGWGCTIDAISSLTAADLSKTVTIRGEAHTVLEAIDRQFGHYASHVGQIVLLAKHFAAGNWKSLSIPRGESETFDVSKDGSPYLIEER